MKNQSSQPGKEREEQSFVFASPRANFRVVVAVSNFTADLERSGKRANEVFGDTVGAAATGASSERL